LNCGVFMSLRAGVDYVDFKPPEICLGGALVPVVDAFQNSSSASSFIAKSAATAKSRFLSFRAVLGGAELVSYSLGVFMGLEACGLWWE
jgi:hypothetical protein